jgi:hypothetical protein
MYSWQGLVLMFMTGSLITMTIMTLWFMYSEVSVVRAKEQLDSAREEEIRRILRKKLLGEEDDDE